MADPTLVPYIINCQNIVYHFFSFVNSYMIINIHLQLPHWGHLFLFVFCSFFSRGMRHSIILSCTKMDNDYRIRCWYGYTDTYDTIWIHSTVAQSSLADMHTYSHVNTLGHGIELGSPSQTISKKKEKEEVNKKEVGYNHYYSIIAVSCNMIITDCIAIVIMVNCNQL